MSKKSTQRKNSVAQSRNTKTPSLLPYLAGLAAVLLIAALAFFIWQANQTRAASTTLNQLPNEISVTQAHDLYNSGVFMLDVREPSEWSEVHIPNATLIPLGELPNRLSELPKDAQIVVVCRSGNRSQSGRDILLQAGFTNVTSMAGGMNEWQASGFPTISDK